MGMGGSRLRIRAEEERGSCARTPPESSQVKRALRTAPARHGDLLALQRSVGNAALVQLLRTTEAAGGQVVQRKGGGGSSTGRLDSKASDQFRRMLAQGGKSKALGTPTYRKVKWGVVVYAAKRNRKPLPWRRKRVLNLEALVDSWLAKGKHLKNTSKVGVAHREAMQWLKPKLQAELASLQPGRPPVEDVKDSESEAELDSGVDTDLEDSEGFTSAKESDEDSVVESSGTTLDDDANFSPTSDSDDDDGFDVSPTTDADDEKVADETKGDTKGDTKDDDDEESSSSSSSSSASSSVSSSSEGDLPKTKDEVLRYLLPTEDELAMTRADRDEAIAARFEKLEAKAKVKVKYASLLTPEMKDLHPSKKGPYYYLKSRGSAYRDEFESGSSVLKELYDKYRSVLTKEKVPHTRELAANWLYRYAGWTRDVFDLYWDRVTKKYGPPPTIEDEASSESEKSEKKTDGEESSSSSSSSSTTMSSESDHDEPIAVVNVGPKERARYQLHLASPIKRGGDDKPYDTADMVSSFSGRGFGIFVMTTNGVFYSGGHNVGIFHHSSFTGGSDVAGAGEMKVVNGKLTELTNKSGHYKPDKKSSVQVLYALKVAGIDLQPLMYTHVDEDSKKDRMPAKQFAFRTSQEQKMNLDFPFPEDWW